MNAKSCPRAVFFGFVLAGAWLTAADVRAGDLDIIGVTVLQATTTNLNGTGIRVAQPEADDPGTPPGTNTWQVNPAAVGQPTNLFSYISANGSTNAYTNALGFESGHAESVARNFYGVPAGVAPGIAHVDNYEADDFFNFVIALRSPPDLHDSIINQSFIFTDVTVSDQQQIDSLYDDYAARYNALFASGAGNGGTISPPATCYNGIGVGVSDGGSSVGPTPDNGRAKPDIIAPGGATSFSTPFVAGAATVLLQAGLRGDGGGDTNSAADIRTIKALLLNGAVKPADWTNNAPSPLDFRYGAGVLNVFNSYEQLAGGKHDFVASQNIISGDPHPPTSDTGTIAALNGWDFNAISSVSSPPPSEDGVNHYYFDVTNDSPNAMFTATITLVWNRQQGQTDINNLDLFLYDAISSNLMASSTSVVDNVEHIFIPRLPQGRYDLQVLKNAADSVTDDETYALAWEFFSTSLTIAQTNSQTTLSWPVYPDGFVLESTTNLASPIVWNTNSSAPVVTGNQNVVVLDTTNASQFFRLLRP